MNTFLRSSRLRGFCAFWQTPKRDAPLTITTHTLVCAAQYRTRDGEQRVTKRRGFDAAKEVVEDYVAGDGNNGCVVPVETAA